MTCLFAVCASLAPAHAGPAAGPILDFWSTRGAPAGDPDAVAGEIVSGMTDEQLLGQLFMLTYPEDTPPPAVFDWIEKRSLGGIKIFGWNGKDTTKLARAVAAMQKAALGSGAGIPLFVATDQEGGWIRHIKGRTSETPGNMAIGASGLVDDAFLSGYYIGKELAVLGVNMNFAPVVDLATRPDSPIIGPRAFSDDPEKVAVLGAAYARGLGEAGIVATAKHYPGHGDTLTDSHGRLPVIAIDEKTLWERELYPFRVLSAQGIPAVMSGHISFPLIAKTTGPASLSPYFMTEILRKRIGFKGVAITDDLYMTAATGTGASAAARLAIESGNDMIMLSRLLEWNEPMWTSLLALCARDAAFRARVTESARRIIAVKLGNLKPRGREALVPDPARAETLLPDPEGQSFFRAQALRSATIIGSASLIPWKPKGRILVASPFSEFFAPAAERYPDSSTFSFSYRPESAASPKELASFKASLKGIGAVLVCVVNEAGADFVREAQAAGLPVAVVSVLSPSPVLRIRKEAAIVAVYSYTMPSLLSGLDVLAGRHVATGRLPIRASP